MNEYRCDVSYGKHRVPVYRVHAKPLTGVAPVPESSVTGRVNSVFALEVDVDVFGDNFLAAYTEGDNSNVIATDSMKNFIIREALDYAGATIEGFLAFLGNRFLATYDQMQTLRLTGRELPFAPATTPEGDGFGPSDVLFERIRDDYFRVSITMTRSHGDVATTSHECAQVDLQLMKITGSSFTRFVRDGYTTLPERRDRPLFIYLDVGWQYGDARDMLEPSRGRYAPAEQVRDVVRSVFHQFVSESIQHLVHEMGVRVLDRFPQLSSVSFVGQNRTKDPFHESSADPRVRVYSDPFSAYGEIRLTMTRG